MKVFVDGFRVFMDDGNKVAMLVTESKDGRAVPVDAVPESAVRVRLEKPRVSPAEKWADKIIKLIGENRSARFSWFKGDWAVANPELVEDIVSVLVEEYDPAPTKRIAKDLDELRRIADGGQVAFVDAEGDLCVWRDGEEKSYWCQSLAYRVASMERDGAFPVEIVRVVKSESQEG